MTDLPGYLQRPPRHEHGWARPTTWLLGAQVASRLKQLLLSQIHRGFDIRDWMSATPPLRSDAVQPAPAPAAPVEPAPGHAPAECWIDYVSDTGDAPRLVYRLAYLLQQDELPVEHLDDAPEPPPFWRWLRRPGKPTPAPDAPPLPALPRGSVLVIGGDTAYPVADEPSLNERVRAPFVWARERLAREGKLVETTRVHLYGLPANHDYYDMLNGFARQFREPCTGEGDDKVAAKSGRPALLQLPGYVRKQHASYFALQLPGGWQLWGIDAENEIDTRQVQYFRDIEPRPRRLIVASSQPVIVHRAPVDERHCIDRAYRELMLPRVYRRRPGQAEAPRPRPGVPAEPELGPDEVRLDLSGDIHLYERYYGVTCSDVAPPGVEPGAEARSNYASVVSGLGGVFHHAGQIRHGDVAAQSAWPLPAQSARALGWMLMRPRMVWQAGSAGILGALFALLLWFLATASEPPRSALHLPWLVASGQPGWLDALAGLGRTAAYLGCVGAWLATWAGARWWRRQVLASMQPAVENWPRASRWLYRIIDESFLQRFLQFFGANSRSVHAIALTAIPRLAVVAGLAGLIALPTLDWFGFDGAHAAANVAVIVFVSMQLALGWMGSARLGARRVFVLALALGHGLLHVLTPLIWTPFLVERPAWIPGLIAAGYLLPRLSWPLLGLGERVRRLAFLALWLALAATLVALPFVLAGGVAMPERAWEHGAVAAFAGAFFTCLWLGWYMVVCVQWNAHGNEAASIARVARYAAFVRIKLDADGAEVWAIQAHEDENEPPNELGERPIVARVIDHFRVGTSASGAAASGQ